MASVHKRARNGVVSYRAVWRESGSGNRPRQCNKSFSKAADAKAYAARMEQEVERKGVGDPDRHTAVQYLRRWLSTLRDRGEHSPTTLEGYARCIELATRQLDGIALSKLSPADLDQAYVRMRKGGGKMRNGPADRPLTARTILNVHRCLHTAFEQARKWKLISENPARDATAPSPERSKARAFTADEVKRLFDAAAASPETYAIVATIVTCGLRRSELIGLTFDALDLEAGTLEICRTVVAVEHQPVIREKTKSTASKRVLAIPPQLVTLLRQQRVRVQENMLTWGRDYRREPLFVFPGLAGTPMIPSTLTHRLRQVMRRARVTKAQPCHGWRHTAATSLLDSGQNIKTVQNRLGHSTPAITLALYVHPVEERDREAAEHFGKLLSR